MPVAERAAMGGVDVTWTGDQWLWWMATTLVERDGTSAPARRAADLQALDDAALVRASAMGQREAFDEIVVRHQKAVYRLCYRLVGNHEDATDLAQEVFLRAYRSIGSFRGDAAVGTWLHRIAVNASLNLAASRARQADIGVEERALPPSPAPDAESLVLGADRAARVREAIARLPPRQRATLILRVYHDMPHREIARLLGSSVGAAKANFFHALGNLERLLRKESR